MPKTIFKPNLLRSRSNIGFDRDGKQITLGEISEKTGLHLNTLEKLEKSDNLEGSRIGTLWKVAKSLNIPLFKEEGKDYYLLEIIEE